MHKFASFSTAYAPHDPYANGSNYRKAHASELVHRSLKNEIDWGLMIAGSQALA
jgi:hypothetical protein